MVEGKDIDMQKFMRAMLLALFAQHSKRNVSSIKENLDAVTEKWMFWKVPWMIMMKKFQS